MSHRLALRVPFSRLALTAAAVCSLVLGRSAAAEVVYVTSFSTGELIRYDTVDPAGTRTVLSGSGTMVAAAAAAFGPDGRLYIGEDGDGATIAPRISRFDPATNSLSVVHTFAAFDVFPGSLAFKGTDLLVGRNPFYGNTGAIVRLAGVTTGSPSVSDYTTGGGLASSPGLAVAADGSLYVSDQTYNFVTKLASGPVKKFDASGAYVGEVIASGSNGLFGPTGLAVNGSRLFTASIMAGTVLQTDLGTGVTQFFASAGGPFEVGSLAGLSDGGLLAGSPSGSGSIYRFGADGTLVGTFSSGLGQVGGVVVAPVPEPSAAGLLAIAGGVALPAVQSARAASRRANCSNNLRQLAIAALNHEAARSCYPLGAESRPWAERPDFPHQFFRWSLLAHMTPYYEHEEILRGLDLSVPLYVGLSADAVAPQNKPIVRLTVPLFLCPGDRMTSVSETFGPTNYAGCAGSGANGGTPFDADGLFFINSRVRSKDIADGLSKTAAFSESLLGEGAVATTDRNAVTAATGYGFTFVAPLTQAGCSRPFYYNFTDLRGFSWANGEYRTTLYNHARLPNDPQIDCLAALMTTADKARMYAGYGWRAARSLHGTGVNVALADGAVRFVEDAVDPTVWRAAATRAGGESEPLP